MGWSNETSQSSQGPDEAEEVSDAILVGRIIAHKVMPAHAIKGILLSAWAFDPHVEISELEPNVFLFEFSAKEPRETVFERQPWNVKGYLLILKRWPLGLNWQEVDLSLS